MIRSQRLDTNISPRLSCAIHTAVPLKDILPRSIIAYQLYQADRGKTFWESQKEFKKAEFVGCVLRANKQSIELRHIRLVEMNLQSPGSAAPQSDNGRDRHRGALTGRAGKLRGEGFLT